MLDLSNPELKFALNAVREACKLASQVQSEMTADEMKKGDRSPVTVADFAVQALIAHHLDEEFQHDVLVAEENSEALRAWSGKNVLEQVVEFVNRFLPDASSEQICKWIDIGKGKPDNRFWTLDPIDGTKGFIRGDQYAVGLSLVKDYQVELAVIGCPNLNTKCETDMQGHGIVAIAVRGQGAWLTSLAEEEPDLKRLHVSQETDLSKVKFLRSVEAAHTNTSRTDQFLKSIENSEEPIYMDSLAKHVALSAGVGDVFFYLLPLKNPDHRMKIWDVTPGWLMIHEAGGKMTDLEGRPIDFSQGLTIAKNPGLIMTNGKIHEEVLKKLKEVRATLPDSSVSG